MSGNSSSNIGLSSDLVAVVARGGLRLVRSDAEGAKDSYGVAVADAPFLFDANIGLARAPEGLGSSIAAP